MAKVIGYAHLMNEFHLKNGAQHSLRRRLFIAISSLVIGTLLVASASFYFFNQHLEDLMLDIIMIEEMSVIQQHLDENPQADLPRASSMRVYIGDAAPDALHDLATGRHHDVSVGGDRYDVYVDTWRDQGIYLLFDIDQIEELENLLFVMLGIMLLMLIWISAMASAVIARRLAGPVDRLAERVGSLHPGMRGVRLQDEFRGDEVEVIAQALDHYIERLEGFIEREQFFTAAASHELRTPLAVILGAIELLKARIEDTGQRKALARMDRASREMMDFIDALLSLSREDYTHDQYRAETRVNDVLGNLCREAREMLQGRNIELYCDDFEPLAVAAPPSLVVIALGNVLRNAIRHTFDGSIRISLKEREFRIEDTGEGIPQESLDRIFERHYSSRGGSGMGLYIVKRICDRYGWVATVDSTPGKGTRVSIRF
jgi:signal transduction histidine kinase